MQSRRSVLVGIGGALTVPTAGCIGSPGEFGGSGTSPSGAAAFFSLEDWANQVVDDVLTFASPVETGEMGHGWDPDADIVAQIAQHDVFCYLNTPEFQWAIDVAEELESDDIDITLLDGMDAISPDELLPFVSTDRADITEPDDDIEYDLDALEITGFDVFVGDDVAAWWHDEHWHGGIPDVPHGGTRHLHFTVEDTRGHVLPLGNDAPFFVNTRIDDGAPTDILSIQNDGNRSILTGESPGQTLIVFELLADDEVIFDTRPDPAVGTVVDPDEIEIDAFYDPHVWVDPVHAQSIVSLIADGLSDAFPEYESTFQANAADYNARVAEIDQQFETLVENAALDVAVLVAHDAFQYLEQRYGFVLQTPVGVTPDAAESIEDVARLAQTIETHEIDTILFDPFAAPNPDEDIPQGANVLLEESSASNVAPLTPAEGTTTQWNEHGYGWIEIMEEINLPSLRKALRAE